MSQRANRPVLMELTREPKQARMMIPKVMKVVVAGATATVIVWLSRIASSGSLVCRSLAVCSLARNRFDDRRIYPSLGVSLF